MRAQAKQGVSTIKSAGNGDETIRNKSGTIRSLSVDHNHDTGEIRGLLCYSCNIMIGMSRDDARILQRGVAYLA